MSNPSQTRFTLLEFIVIVCIVLLLITVSAPTGHRASLQASQNKALQQSKGIFAGLKLFAGDHDGHFPAGINEDYQDAPGASRGPLRDANDAYANLCPNYMSDEKPFQVPESAWCWNEKGEVVQITNDFTARDKVLTKGMNHYAYVAGLTDESNARNPIIADGFAGESGPVAAPHYVKDPSQRGGVWHGVTAIVVRCDGSAGLGKIGQNDGVVSVNVGGEEINLFVPVTNSKVKWLEGCRVLNPK